uniref:Uncharacterized protein n=1 Tax=Pyrodinium bahamense TaxID=73915 RepID=A0A7S0FZM2_9DINO
MARSTSRSYSRRRTPPRRRRASPSNNRRERRGRDDSRSRSRGRVARKPPPARSRSAKREASPPLSPPRAPRRAARSPSRPRSRSRSGAEPRGGGGGRGAAGPPPEGGGGASAPTAAGAEPMEITFEIVDGVTKLNGSLSWRAEVYLPRPVQADRLGGRPGTINIRGPSRLDRKDAERDGERLKEAAIEGGAPATRSLQRKLNTEAIEESRRS